MPQVILPYVMAALLTYHLRPAEVDGRHIGTEIFIMYPSDGPTERVCLVAMEPDTDIELSQHCFKPTHTHMEVFIWEGHYLLTDTYLVLRAYVRLPDGRIIVQEAVPRERDS